MREIINEKMKKYPAELLCVMKPHTYIHLHERRQTIFFKISHN